METTRSSIYGKSMHMNVIHEHISGVRVCACVRVLCVHKTSPAVDLGQKHLKISDIMKTRVFTIQI